MNQNAMRADLSASCSNLRGVALVADVSGGLTEIASHAGGFADFANERPNVVDTRFATASAGKAFVAVGIMQLVEQGKLDLDMRLSELVDFHVHESWRSVTVKELLSHTSGVPDYFDEDEMDDYAELWLDLPNYKIRRSSDLLPLFAGLPARFEAGSRFQYNNSGYVLLGLIIESVTGMLFDEYLAQAVFSPAGMTHTGYYELDRLPQGCANSYIQDAQGQWYTNIYSVDVKGTGAGGAFTTVEDIARFWAALNNGVLVSNETRDLMWSVHARSEDSTSEEPETYGLGFWIESRGGVFTPKFEGYDPGVSFVSSFTPSSGIAIVLVSNYCDNLWEIKGKIS